MSEAVTPRRFHEVDWRVVRNDASKNFRTGSFAEGLALVSAIGGPRAPRTIMPTSTSDPTA